MLEIKALSAFYGKNKVLDEINLTFESGKFYAVIGRNSSGKSTLLNCLSSIMKYDGSILLDGKSICRYSARDRAKKISILPQQVMSVPFTAKELVCFGRSPYGDSPAAESSMADKAMAEAGIEKFANKKVNELSGGERQLCHFTMNLCQASDIMLLDEPTASLDMEHEARILSLAKKRCGMGKTVICVIHNLTQAVEYADEIIVLDRGRCVFSGTKHMCLENEIIEKNFGVRKFISDGKIFFCI